jgi:hypothetical protein
LFQKCSFTEINGLQVLVLIAFIVACIAASKIHSTTTDGGSGNGFGQAAVFAAMWTVLLLLIISVVGTIIMRRVRIIVVNFFSN